MGVIPRPRVPEPMVMAKFINYLFAIPMPAAISAAMPAAMPTPMVIIPSSIVF